jgi:hypothetical protein
MAHIKITFFEKKIDRVTLVAALNGSKWVQKAPFRAYIQFLLLRFG